MLQPLAMEVHLRWGRGKPSRQARECIERRAQGLGGRLGIYNEGSSFLTNLVHDNLREEGLFVSRGGERALYPIFWARNLGTG